MLVLVLGVVASEVRIRLSTHSQNAASPYGNVRDISFLIRRTLKPSGHANAEPSKSGPSLWACVENIEKLPHWGKDMFRSSVKTEWKIIWIISHMINFQTLCVPGVRRSECDGVGGFFVGRHLHSSGHRSSGRGIDCPKRVGLALQQCRDDMAANSTKPKPRNGRGNDELSVKSFNFTKGSETIHRLPLWGKEIVQFFVKTKSVGIIIYDNPMRTNLHAHDSRQGQGHLVPCLSEV